MTTVKDAIAARALRQAIVRDIVSAFDGSQPLSTMRIIEEYRRRDPASPDDDAAVLEALIKEASGRARAIHFDVKAPPKVA